MSHKSIQNISKAPNLRLSYLYRDSGNYKTYADPVFENPDGITPAEALPVLQQAMVENHYFLPQRWGLPDLSVAEWDADFPAWHEFTQLEPCSEPADHELNFTDFLQRIQISIAIQV